MNRRTFVKQSAAAATLLGSFGIPSGALAGKPSQQVRLAVLGTNSRGLQMINLFQDLPGVSISHICDPETNAGAKGVQQVVDKGGPKPEYLMDFRRALELKDVDGVVITTPDHWHTPAALLALQAGKHVYVEKPLSHNPAEGEMMVRAMLKYPRLAIQLGNQRRSAPAIKAAVELVRGGRLGRAYHAKTWYCRNRGSIGIGKEVPVPSNLDWELWQGPAARETYRDNIVHYNWHWFFNWGTGEVANNGMHEMDVARWIMGLKHPSRVTSTARRHRFEDDWQFWDIQVAGFEYEQENASIVWEGHSVDAVAQFGTDRGCMVFCDEGQILLGSNSYTILDKDGNVIESFQPDSASGDETDTVAPTADLTMRHAENFIDAIRGDARVNSPMDEGHVSTMMCHYANIAQQCGGAIAVDQANGKILHNQQAQSMWSRTYAPGWEPVV